MDYDKNMRNTSLNGCRCLDCLRSNMGGEEMLDAIVTIVALLLLVVIVAALILLIFLGLFLDDF